MNTIIKKIQEEQCTLEDFTIASKILQQGGLVAFPTETVYGLGANGLDEEAAKKIYAAKGRPSDNPLILHIADMKALEVLAVDIKESAYELAKHFWPGPLTMIFKKSDIVPYGTTGGLDTVAIRMPQNKIALELIRNSGVYIAAPSANSSGKPSPTMASHVVDDLSGKIDMILDGGKVSLGLESTIVDMTGDYPLILRPGFITKDMMEKVVGLVEYDPAILSKDKSEGIKPKAPGMKYKHYAPVGDLTIYEGPIHEVVAQINKRSVSDMENGLKVGIIATEETKGLYQGSYVKTIGTRLNEKTIAGSLYGILREFDDLQVDTIYSESFGNEELGQAIMNRLIKAAGYQIIKVENSNL